MLCHRRGQAGQWLQIRERAVLGDVGQRLDGLRRVLARKLLDAVSRFGATTGIAAHAFRKRSSNHADAALD